jgi:hypothetical protein
LLRLFQLLLLLLLLSMGCSVFVEWVGQLFILTELMSFLAISTTCLKE